MTYVRTAAHNAAIGRAQIGRVQSAATRAKIGAAQRGVPEPPWSDERRTRSSVMRVGPLNPMWKDDWHIDYNTVHRRLRDVLPRICAHCGTTEGRLEVALIHGVHVGLRSELWWAHRVFATDASAYIRLCKSCHTKYDRWTS